MDQEQLRDLLGRCALKDQAALKRLYDQTSGYLNAVAFNILRSEEWSNEVLQEAFVQIWQNAASYRPYEAQPLTWMCSIVRYRALDKQSAERKHLAQRDFEASLDEVGSAGAGPETAQADHEQARHLEECLQTLNERGQRCIRLAYLQGYSRDELAQVFDTNVNTIKSWLRRNVQRLKACLTQKNLATS